MTYKGLKFLYNLSYSWNENKTPLDAVYKRVNNNLNCLYNIGYNKSFLNNRISLAAGYQGNYTRNKIESFAEQSGSIEARRTPVAGQYGIGYPDSTSGRHTCSNPYAYERQPRDPCDDFRRHNQYRTEREQVSQHRSSEPIRANRSTPFTSM